MMGKRLHGTCVDKFDASLASRDQFLAAIAKLHIGIERAHIHRQLRNS
jgi:hypothetical protein